ncbi:MAG TPA: STAS domain-containing protein [Burkholderiales bacterium]|nr:STAS domain-containing protein [Burkholderiales bacterium]
MISCEGERCLVEGPITIGNATAVLAESQSLFTNPRMVVDLAGVTEVDSAAVSLLLEWRRSAARANRQIAFVNPPQSLKSLAELYGVWHLLAPA